ncbi:MAG TPA: hypothetical protein VIV40_27205 [Kofleriaceae bacterium]
MLRLAALIPFALVALVACVDSGDEGIYVLNNSAVTGESCTLSGSPDQAMVGHGQVNVLSPVAYVMTPLIESRIQSVDGVDDTSKTVQLRGADIKLTIKAVSIERGGQFMVTQPETALPPFSVLFSGSLKPGGSVNAFVELIPPGTIRQIAQMSGANLDTDSLNSEVLAEVTIKGDLGGSSVESQPYFYPVTICNDCIVVNNGACPMTVAPRAGNACNPYQDGVVDCCVDASNNLVCPGSTTMM